MRPVEYCTTADGVRIAYRRSGKGPALIMCPLFVDSFSLDYISPELLAFEERIGRNRTLVRFDIRGTGLSAAAAESISADALALDLEAVAAAIGTPVAIFAHGESTIYAVMFAAGHPELVEGLVIWGGFHNGSAVAPPDRIAALASLCREAWTLAATTIANLTETEPGSTGHGSALAKLYRRSCSGELAAQLLEAIYLMPGVTALLPQVQAPTLVVHRRRDGAYPFSGAQEMATLIPGATLLPLEGSREATPLYGEAGLDEIDAFLRLRQSAVPVATQVPVPLSEREIEVLALISAGLSSRKIADELGLSVRTIGRHITNLYVKIDAHNRAEAASYALRHGIGAHE